MYFPKPAQTDDKKSSVSDSAEKPAVLAFKPQRYEVDLSNHIAVCEMNYRKLLKLLPGLRNGTSQWAFSAGASVKEEYKSSYFDVNIAVIDTAPYTTTLSIEQEHGVLSTPKIVVRLYHDADLAEIISWDGHRNWHPQYKYPNICLLYTSPSPRDKRQSRMPSSA